MRYKILRITFLILVLILIKTTPAPALLYIGSSGSLSASASFLIDGGGNLQVILTNTSSADVSNPSQVLTALFFDIVGVGALTPVSALLDGSTVFFGPDGGGNVGGEWAYGSGLVGAPGSATEGISSSGLGLFGNGNFGGADLDPPAAVNGGNYGITSQGDNLASGNAAVTGNEPLIQNAVTFTLSGIPVGFLPSSTNITQVSFQYGTDLSDSQSSPNIPGQPSTGVPEPSTMLLYGSGLLILAKSVRGKRNL